MWIYKGIWIYTCVYIYLNTYTNHEFRSICTLFWIVLDLFGQGTKAQYGRRGSELEFAAGTAILCAEIMSSNGNG